VRAILRRRKHIETSTNSVIHHISDLTIDPGSREVTINGQRLSIRTQEFELLLTFVRHRGFVLSREKLLELAWGYDFAGQTRTVDVHVGNLRKKLAISQVRIETVTGIGYKLVVD
ncbi:MAG: response regulator transcription factor, partial [Chloroflexi bacterium]|nr:response regulator transcription factor [Chloroflexota bacterium]